MYKPTCRLATMERILFAIDRMLADPPLSEKALLNILQSTSSKFEEKDEQEDLLAKRIKDWWPEDEKFYAGVVDSYDNKQKKHKIIYDDGDIEKLNLREEQWERIES